YPSYIIQSLVASILCTVGAALFVLKEELRDNPSNLMRAKAPKLGKKILLERITPLWSRLNFNQKVTFRNLFRYKQRMLMTILGISGCMAMLVAGISLQQSNSSFMDIQFDKLINYDAIVVFNDKPTENQNLQYEESLKDLKGYDSSLNVYQDSVTFSKENMSKQTATMYVPESKEELNKYILLNDRVSKEKYNLSDKGAIINEKLAKLLGVSVGDNVILHDSNNNPHEVKIENIVENYTGHNIYLSPAYYKNIFKTEPVYNAQLLKLNSDVTDENIVAEELMKNDKVINVTLTSKIRSMSESADLGLVMIVIIIASGSLAFVVLYNLININVSERIREISTIKVLGFHDNEVDMYIFRENIILTILGILAGTVMGKILYVFLVSTAEMDNMMMIPTVNMSSYVISGVITMIFAILVMVMMHKKLKNINMIDALKSIE
ncbi:MAG: ABC transporter permease, partial [Peptostreptococcaceae bacterium]